LREVSGFHRLTDYRSHLGNPLGSQLADESFRICMEIQRTG
jgi:hypothetical protein